MATALHIVRKEGHPAGLSHWMLRVVRECGRASLAFAPDPVHDLRVALRRCRSMADGVMSVDPHPDWRAMRKAGRKVFRRLGELRDLQVTLEWIEKLAPPDDPVRVRLTPALQARELELKEEARAALTSFDLAQWRRWARTLPLRAKRLPLDGPVFQHLAIERWQEARALHRQATHTRSQVGWHRLRIGLKRFRYTVENFLPSRASWLADLKRLQDLLGEVHDLDVLAGKYFTRSRMFDEATRAAWLARIQAARERRMAEFRSRMTGPKALWHEWRQGLPDSATLPNVALEKLRAWARFSDRRFPRTLRVVRLALELFDGLSLSGAAKRQSVARARRMLHAAALLHNIAGTRKKTRHKAAFRRIREFPTPPGWTRAEMNRAALIARYHRGAEPRETHAEYARLSPAGRHQVALLAGILRLADGFTEPAAGPVRTVRVQRRTDVVMIRGKNYREGEKSAALLGGKKHLLETALGKPIIVCAWDSPLLGKPPGPRRVPPVRFKPRSSAAKPLP